MLGLPSAWGLSFAAREVSSPLPSALVSCFEGRGCHRRQGPRVRTAFLLDQSRTARLLAGSRGHGDSESCL